MSHWPNKRQLTFDGQNSEELLNFIDEKFGDRGCLLLEYKKFGVWNYEKGVRSCTIVFYKSGEETCDIYLWGTGGGGVDSGSVRDAVAKEISKYAVDELKLKKTYDAAEDI